MYYIYYVRLLILEMFDVNICVIVVLCKYVINLYNRMNCNFIIK